MKKHKNVHKNRPTRGGPMSDLGKLPADVCGEPLMFSLRRVLYAAVQYSPVLPVHLDELPAPALSLGQHRPLPQIFTMDRRVQTKPGGILCRVTNIR